MIVSFRFKNFRSFQDETFIDMKAVCYKEFPSHLIAFEDHKLLKTFAVYGANASGKTNLLNAFSSFHSFIWEQLFPLRVTSKNHLMSFSWLGRENKIIPFQMTDVNPQPTEMELCFISDQRVYEYGFTICGQNVLTEHLIVDHHMVYIREEEEFSMGRLFENIPLKKLGLHPNDKRLFCSVLSCLNIPEIKAIMKPFEHFFSEHIAYCFDILDPLQFLGRTAIEERICKILGEPDALIYGLEQIRKLGIPVEDLIMDHGIPMLGYRMKSRATNQYQTNYMDFTKVSASTMNHLSLFIKIYNLSQKGGVLIIDNISNKFQPAVVKLIVDFFQQENNKNIQLIFTTYDSSILNSQQFRRDEVAFVDINEYQESKLYTLTDMMVQCDFNISVERLLRKYNNVPFIKDYIYKD